MNIASQTTHTSLAQRIAKVRNCMLVELSTGVSTTDKDLFASPCQTYEQRSVGISSFSNGSSDDSLRRMLSVSYGVQGNTTQQWPEYYMLRKDFSQWQLMPDFGDDDDDQTDIPDED